MCGLMLIPCSYFMVQIEVKINPNDIKIDTMRASGWVSLVQLLIDCCENTLHKGPLNMTFIISISYVQYFISKEGKAVLCCSLH